MSSRTTRSRWLEVLVALALCLPAGKAHAEQALPYVREVPGQTQAVEVVETGKTDETGKANAAVEAEEATDAGESGGAVEGEGKAAVAPEAPALETQAEDALEVTVQSIRPSGNVVLAISPADLLERFALGDVVSVSAGAVSVDVPVVGAYSDVDSGSDALVVQQERGACRLATNMGSFAETYGITADTAFRISLKEKGGYAYELILHSLKYTDERGDYPHLTDEQFANFRPVTTTGMGKGVLYRSASPVDPLRKRNAYADAALRRANVTVVLNLVDDEGKLAGYEGYADSYYASISHVARAMSMNFTNPATQEALAEELRFLAAHPGTYDIHCLEGKDRTGFVVALLESLMGASQDEVVADYMESFANYYGVTAEDPRYERIARGGIVKTLERAFGVEDLSACNLADEAAGYLARIGLTAEEVSAIRNNLSGAPAPADDAEKNVQNGAKDQAQADPATRAKANAGRAVATVSAPRGRGSLPATGGQALSAAGSVAAVAATCASVLLCLAAQLRLSSR